MRKQLRKPENWEDFESLCKKLWGEIWACGEIKKNGRKGQIQNGVDIYGIPRGEKLYYGIQCKGKDEYSNKQLSENEIDREINFAKSFKPPLAKFYFATTANKDAKIEEFIRIKDLENRQQELFEVHLFSWEDIVDLIDENKETHDWYLSLQKHKTNSNVLVSFENNENKLTGSVPFCEKFTHFKQRTASVDSIFNYTPNRFQPKLDNFLFKGENRSYFRFKIKIKNTGNTPLENSKLVVQVNGEHYGIDDENFDTIFINQNINTDIEINNKQGNFSINPHRVTLAPDEEYVSNFICIKPKTEGSEVDIIWKFISNNFKKEGFLKIDINTYLIRKDVEKNIEFKSQEIVARTIEDYIEEGE